MADVALRFIVRGSEGAELADPGATLTATLPSALVTATGDTVPKSIPDHLAFIGRTQRTQELSGAPSDLPPGYHRIVWNTTTNRPSCWMNRAGTIIDAFDPNSYA